MTQQKIKWRSVSNNITEIRLVGENNDDPIGHVKSTINFKWDIHPYFAILVEDKHHINKQYNTDIEAGRILVKLWNMLKEVNIKDTEEYFVNFDDMFGPID